MPAFDEVARSGGHFDASFHVGGHGEPWADMKCLVITWNGQTYVCVRRDGAETVTEVPGVRQGLALFAGQLADAIGEVGRHAPAV